MAAILRIEHPVDDYARWREAFDSDPEGRERSGVRRYRIMRACADPSLVLIDLEFAGPEPAEEFLSRLNALWQRVDVMHDPRARVVVLVEEKALTSEASPAYD